MAGESMVERVARAIMRADLGSQWPLIGGDDLQPDPHDLFIARTAIEAMREPTAYMIDACLDLIGGTCDINGTEADRGYAAMIDAALQETANGTG